jgi:protein involved in polysaccharide export with SLBB domain
MKILRIAAAVTLLGLSATAAASAALHPGDKVNIQVYNHPELSTQTTIDGRGLISLPLVGTVSAAGTDEKELGARIQAKLTSFMQYPAVDVMLLAQSPDIFISGGPGGTIQYRPGDTLSGALNDLAVQCKCSLKDTAGDTAHIRIIRDKAALGPYNMDDAALGGSNDPDVQPGDRIAFANKPVAVQVKGEVKSPGLAYLATDEPLSDALTQTGGLTANASYAQILLDRGGTLTQISEGSPEFSQPAKPGDVLTIPSQERIQVMGAVGTQGEVTLKEDFTLVSAIYYAGGPTKWADLSAVTVRHHGTTRAYNLGNMEHGKQGTDPALEDGDVVFVPEGHKVDWRGFFQDLVWFRWLVPHI